MSKFLKNIGGSKIQWHGPPQGGRRHRSLVASRTPSDTEKLLKISLHSFPEPMADDVHCGQPPKIFGAGPRSQSSFVDSQTHKHEELCFQGIGI